MDYKKFKIKIITSFLLSFVISLVTLISVHIPRIYVPKEVNFSYQDIYQTPLYEARNYKDDFTDKVTVTDTVDSSTIGTYYVDYSLKYGISNIHKKVIVNIIDDVPPIIKLKGEDTVNVCPNTIYEEEGYEAIDEYDGDLTNNVITEATENYITYQVKDNSSNEIIVVRNITYSDTTKPDLTLKGSKITYVKLGSKYNESGYTAKDNCDGDITDKVTVSGTVDTKKAGKYTITYKAVDNSNNETTAERTIYVYKNTIANTGSGEKGVIYLTFDDGPSNAITKAILDILKDEGVKATFFVTMSGSDSVINREYNEGQTVALHTATHTYSKIYKSVDAYFKDLDTVKERVKRITGTDPKIIRFPGGSSNTVSRNYNKGIMTVLTSEVLNRGYRYFDWNVDSGDAGGCVSASNKSKCVYNNVTRNLSKKRSNVVLMHDIKSYTKDALRDIIAYGKVNGYTFKAITEDTAMVVQKVNN